MALSDRRVVSTTGRAIEESAIGKFQARLSGRLIRPGDSDYETARHVWNRAFDKHPALIVRCANSSDVLRAVEFGRGNDLMVAVRGGGHSFSGKSTCDGGMVIDFSLMKTVEVDPARQVAHAQSGVNLAEFDHATQAFGLATTMGTFAPTGIAGLTLGGGWGWLLGKYGLSCDNLIAADLVTADGRLLTASEEENPDLLWGLRGGGGNFGVVTSFTYRLHRVDRVLGGILKYEPADLSDLLRFCRDYAPATPDELTMLVGFLPLAQPAVGVALCYCGDFERGKEILKPLRSFRKAVSDSIRPLTYLELQNMLDAPTGSAMNLGNYTKSAFLPELSDGAIDALVGNCAQAPSLFCAFWLNEIHGAVSRVGLGDTAYPLREHGYECEIWSIWENAADADASTTWVRDLWNSLQPFADGRAYVNHLLEEGDRVETAYGANYKQLVALKNKYDPTNFFRLNQNIKPTV
jgi:FAD/FMN-containing dehydrogenase